MFQSMLKSIGNKVKWKNWAENIHCELDCIHYPVNEEEVQKILGKARTAGKKIRMVGQGHSFSPLVATEDQIISLSRMTGIIALDKKQNIVEVWAGTPLKELNHQLYDHGFALINLGDIDVQSLAGSTATGTHGTGIAFGNISSEIVGFTIVLADGSILDCDKDQNTDLYEAGRISLGALGVITRIRLNVHPKYKLAYTSSAAGFEETLQLLEKHNQENRNFEFYYFPYTETVQLKASNLSDAPIKSSKLMEYINDVLIENAVMQLICHLAMILPFMYKQINRFMAWGFTKEHKVKYSHQVYATVRNVRFKEMEYNIPIEYFKECISEIKAQIEQAEYFLFFPIECRFVKEDDIWLSPAYKRMSAYIAIHVYQKTAHQPYFKDIEQIFKKYNGRPHWGKMHSNDVEYLAQQYERWEDFKALRNRMDPDGLFLNDHLIDLFGTKIELNSKNLV